MFPFQRNSFAAHGGPKGPPAPPLMQTGGEAKTGETPNGNRSPQVRFGIRTSFGRSPRTKIFPFQRKDRVVQADQNTVMEEVRVIGKWSRKGSSNEPDASRGADWRDGNAGPSFGGSSARGSKPRQLYEDDADVALLLEDGADGGSGGENGASDGDAMAELEPGGVVGGCDEDSSAAREGEDIGALEHSATGRIGDNTAAAKGEKAGPKAARKVLGERTSDITRAMDSLNARLSELARQIRTSQPKRHGAVLLQLNSCGRGCVGCPHPRWQKWVNRSVENPMMPVTWFAVTVESPLAATRKLEYTEETRDLIRTSVAVLAQKAALVKALNGVNQIIKQRKILPEQQK